MTPGASPTACRPSRTPQPRRPDTAVTLAAAADRLREQISMRPHPADDVISRYHLRQARQRIGQERFEAIWAWGREASAESVVAVALATPARSRTDRAGASRQTLDPRTLQLRLVTPPPAAQLPPIRLPSVCAGVARTALPP